ncbi:NUDIX hydrolase [Cohnella boryungensis]|uniref:NUDIX domain-containing protein n=1 Tax=Cohnella boryungensis TaxID=768479 RepID=A0ABV8S7K4_9BACL
MAEIFDIYDEQGNWTGTADRREVHAKGLWHRTVHCWLVRREYGNGSCAAKVLIQQRSDRKDTNPGCFDITAAGHLQAGESPEAVVRELEEELGVKARFEQLREYGIIREQCSGVVGNIAYIDNEVSYVFGLETRMKLEDYRLQEEEVSGLYEADADELLALMENRLERALVRGIVLKGGKPQAADAQITRSSFVERDVAYYINVIKFLQEMIKS